MSFSLTLLHSFPCFESSRISPGYSFPLLLSALFTFSFRYLFSLEVHHRMCSVRRHTFGATSRVVTRCCGTSSRLEIHSTMRQSSNSEALLQASTLQTRRTRTTNGSDRSIDATSTTVVVSHQRQREVQTKWIRSRGQLSIQSWPCRSYFLSVLSPNQVICLHCCSTRVSQRSVLYFAVSSCSFLFVLFFFVFFSLPSCVNVFLYIVWKTIWLVPMIKWKETVSMLSFGFCSSADAD